jgi:hypothetical protein
MSIGFHPRGKRTSSSQQFLQKNLHIFWSLKKPFRSWIQFFPKENTNQSGLSYICHILRGLKFWRGVFPKQHQGKVTRKSGKWMINWGIDKGNELLVEPLLELKVLNKMKNLELMMDSIFKKPFTPLIFDSCLGKDHYFPWSPAAKCGHMTAMIDWNMASKDIKVLILRY